MARTTHGYFINGSGDYEDYPDEVTECEGYNCSECRQEIAAFYTSLQKGEQVQKADGSTDMADEVTPKGTNWHSAIKAARRHPEGELVNVNGKTLRQMEKAGRVYRRNGKWYAQGMGPGPVEEPQTEEPVVPRQSDKVAFDFVEEPSALARRERTNELLDALVSEPQRSPQRASFDNALNVLLIKENLNGTEWAIKQIREIAEKKDDSLGAELSELANQLEDRLDMRAAHLVLGD